MNMTFYIFDMEWYAWVELLFGNIFVVHDK